MRAVPQFTFNAGELSPRMHGRADLEKYSAGCAELTNFIPLPQGGIISRAGTNRIAFDADVNAIGRSSRLIPFSPSSTNSYLLYFYNNRLDVYRDDGTKEQSAIVTPYPLSALKDLRYAQRVDTLIIVHPAYPPQILKFLDANPAFELTALTLETDFKSPPFDLRDTSSTELRVSNEVRYLKVTSAGAGFTAADIGLYFEARIADFWGLYKILGNAPADGGAPADPVSDVCYVLPITAVVKDIDPKAQFVLLNSTYPTTEQSFIIGVDDNWELRSDTAVFRFDLEDAYLRVPLNYNSLGTQGKRLWSTGVETSTDPVWVKLIEYMGQEEYSVDLHEGVFNAAAPLAQLNPFLAEGKVYKIVDAAGFKLQNGGNTPLNSDLVFDITNVKWDLSFRYQKTGDTFLASNFFKVEAAGGADTKVANLSNSKTFDIAKVSKPLAMRAAATIPAPVFDDSTSVHTATLTASKDTFVAGDVGRYIHVRHGSRWVLYKITAHTSPTVVSVDVEGVIPTAPNSSEFINDGRSQTFAFSLWSANSYPATVAFFEQRLVFGGTTKNPETICFSKATDIYDFRTIESDGQVLDTSGISYNLGGSSYNQITWMVGGKVLLVGTQSSEWQLRSVNFGDPLTPMNVRLSQETFVGSSLNALSVGSATIFVDRSGKYVRELIFDYEINAFRTIDLNVIADHLFENDPIVDTAFQATPRPLLWCITASGKAYTLTYERDQKVYAWARHITNGLFKSIAITNRSDTGLEDKVHFIVDRNVRCLETLLSEFYDSGANNFKEGIQTLDCQHRVNVSSAGVARTRLLVLPLSYYNQEVSLIIDGAYMGEFVVEQDPLNLMDFYVNLNIPKIIEKYWMIGYKFTSRLQTLPLSLTTETGTTVGAKGRIKNMGIQLLNTVGLAYGPSVDELVGVNFHGTITTMDQSPKLFSGFKDDFTFDGSYELSKQVVVEQSQPYPISILSLTPHI